VPAKEIEVRKKSRKDKTKIFFMANPYEPLLLCYWIMVRKYTCSGKIARGL
jgi:hypothetical protein